MRTKPNVSKRSSRNGTTPMAKSSLSSQEVCDIIKVCAETQALELKFDGLHIRFGTKAKDNPPLVEPDPLTKSNSDAEISEKQHAQLTKDSLEDDELRTREDQLAELLITDPLAAEEMLRNEELEDADDDQESE